jgi:hypothetical protein
MHFDATGPCWTSTPSSFIFAAPTTTTINVPPQYSNSSCTAKVLEGTSITCSCTHLSNFAARYVATRSASPNVYAVVSPVVLTHTINMDPALLLLLLGLCAMCAATSAAFAKADALGLVRYGVALSSDADVRFLRQLTEAQGKAWVMDRMSGAVEGTPMPAVYWGRAYAAVLCARLGARAAAVWVAPAAPQLRGERLVQPGGVGGGSAGSSGTLADSAISGLLRGGATLVTSAAGSGEAPASNATLRVSKEDMAAAGILSTLPGGAFDDSHSHTFAETGSPTLAALFLRLLGDDLLDRLAPLVQQRVCRRVRDAFDLLVP